MQVMMHQHLEELLDAGYHVEFDLTGEDVEVFIEKLDEDGNGVPGENWTAVEDTAARALWTASPLHGDDEPYPDAEKVEADVIKAIMENGYDHGLRAGRMENADDRQRALETGFRDLVAEIQARVDALVNGRDVGAGQAGIDSHLWRCSKCGGECIGGEPADSVCRGCGGA